MRLLVALLLGLALTGQSAAEVALAPRLSEILLGVRVPPATLAAGAYGSTSPGANGTTAVTTQTSVNLSQSILKVVGAAGGSQTARVILRDASDLSTVQHFRLAFATTSGLTDQVRIDGGTIWKTGGAPVAVSSGGLTIVVESKIGLLTRHDVVMDVEVRKSTGGPTTLERWTLKLS